MHRVYSANDTAAGLSTGSGCVPAADAVMAAIFFQKNATNPFELCEKLNWKHDDVARSLNAPAVVMNDRRAAGDHSNTVCFSYGTVQSADV